MQLLIKLLDSRTIVINVDSSASIASVKEEVWKREAIPHEMQRFVYNGRNLRDDASLSDYLIEEDSTLTLYPRGFDKNVKENDKLDHIWITIKPLLGSTRSISVDPRIEIGALKRVIQNLFAVGADKQRLVFRGESLDDGMNIELYGIGDGDTITLIPENQCSCVARREMDLVR